MASTINGTSTGSGGLISTGDDSGILNIQTNETTAISINASQGVEFNAGTAALPTITTTGDTNTGIFFPAADQVAVSAGGTQKALFGTGSATIDGLTVGKGGGAVSTNTAVGASALAANQAGGTNNTAIGNAALDANTTGDANTAVGDDALGSNTTASNNTAVGYQAGYSNTTGNGNIFIGQGAGTTRATTGDFNILIGATAQNSATAGANEIVIGTNNPTGKGSSTGFINPAGGGMYQGNNSSSWSTTSDQRLKKNIVDNTEGLDKISQIRVRNFEYRLPEEVTELNPECAINKQGVQLGVIAQELREFCPDCVKEESTGVISVDSDNIFWHMINAIKDLKALVDAQATEITALKAKVA